MSSAHQYLAEETFPSLPPEIRTLSYATVQEDTTLAATYEPPLAATTLEALIKPLPASVSDSLISYNLLQDPSDLDRLLEAILNSYLGAATAAAPSFARALSVDQAAVDKLEASVKDFLLQQLAHLSNTDATTMAAHSSSAPTAPSHTA